MVGGQPRMGPAPRHPRSPASAKRPASRWNLPPASNVFEGVPSLLECHGAPRRPVIGGVGRSDPFAVARQVARAGRGHALVHAFRGGRPRAERRTTPPVTGRANSGGAGSTFRLPGLSSTPPVPNRAPRRTAEAGDRGVSGAAAHSRLPVRWHARDVVTRWSMPARVVDRERSGERHPPVAGRCHQGGAEPAARHPQARYARSAALSAH